MAKATKRLVICVDNSGHEVSLERRKIYVSLPDTKAERLGHIRVIDESGEDYLYPRESFVEVALPTSVRRAVMQAAQLTLERTVRDEVQSSAKAMRMIAFA